MKKKPRDLEEAQENTNNKQTENKEATHDPDSNIVEINDNSASAGPAESLSEGGTNESNGADKPVSESNSVEEKLAEMQDKYIRLSAEFDNYRKRTLREKMDLSKYAGENILQSIIPLMDDFERAMKHIDSATDCVGLKDGIDLIYGKFGDFLKQNGIKEIESLNSNFNVDLHEAVAKIPVDDPEKKGKVTEVVLKGYYMQDKVLRFAKVVVGE